MAEFLENQEHFNNLPLQTVYQVIWQTNWFKWTQRQVEKDLQKPQKWKPECSGQKTQQKLITCQRNEAKFGWLQNRTYQLYNQNMVAEVPSAFSSCYCMHRHVQHRHVSLASLSALYTLASKRHLIHKRTARIHEKAEHTIVMKMVSRQLIFLSQISVHQMISTSVFKEGSEWSNQWCMSVSPEDTQKKREGTASSPLLQHTACAESRSCTLSLLPWVFVSLRLPI